MIRWVIVAAVVGLAGCKGSPKPSCDPATPPTLDWAYAEYLAQGGPKFDYKGGLQILDRTSFKGLSDLIHDPGAHQETSFLGTVYRCKLYRDARQLAKVLLLEEGWAAANAPMRHTLAAKIHGEMISRPLAAADKNWDPAQAFTPPDVTTMPDTGVKLVYWHAYFEDVMLEDGTGFPAYAKEEVVIAPDGTVGETKKLASYKRDKRTE